MRSTRSCTASTKVAPSSGSGPVPGGVRLKAGSDFSPRDARELDPLPPLLPLLRDVALVLISENPFVPLPMLAAFALFAAREAASGGRSRFPSASAESAGGGRGQLAVR